MSDGPLETVWCRTLPAADARAYDDFLASARGAHYAQHAAWAKVAVAGRPRTARFFIARSRGRIVGTALVLLPAVGPLHAPVAVIERGPVCDDPADLDRVLAALVRVARRHGVVRLSAMPYWADEDAARAEASLVRAGFRDVQTPDGAHATTLRMDVGGKTDEAILAGKERATMRKWLNGASRVGATVRRAPPIDMAILERLDTALNASQGRSTRAPWFAAAAAYLRDDPSRGALLVCEHEGAAVSAVLALRHARTTVYCAGASIVEARSFSKMAPPLFEAARWARDEGCDVFDLGGVPAEGDDDPKRGAIAQFKRGLSRTPVRLVREHVRWF